MVEAGRTGAGGGGGGRRGELVGRCSRDRVVESGEWRPGWSLSFLPSPGKTRSFLAFFLFLFLANNRGRCFANPRVVFLCCESVMKR